MDVENHDAVAALLLLHQYPPSPSSPSLPPSSPPLPSDPQQHRDHEEKEGVNHDEDQPKKSTGVEAGKDEENTEIKTDDSTISIHSSKERNACCKRNDDSDIAEKNIHEQSGEMDVSVDSIANVCNHSNASISDKCTSSNDGNDNDSQGNNALHPACSSITKVDINVSVTSAGAKVDNVDDVYVATEGKIENNGKEPHCDVVSSISCSGSGGHTDQDEECRTKLICSSATDADSCTASPLENEMKKNNNENDKEIIDDQEKQAIPPKISSPLQSSSQCNEKIKPTQKENEPGSENDNRIKESNDNDHKKEILEPKGESKELVEENHRKEGVVVEVVEEFSSQGKEQTGGHIDTDGDSAVVDTCETDRDTKLQSQLSPSPSCSLSSLSSSCKTKTTPNSNRIVEEKLENKTINENGHVEVSAKNINNNATRKGNDGENQESNPCNQEMANSGSVKTVTGFRDSVELQHQKQQQSTITSTIIPSHAPIAPTANSISSATLDENQRNEQKVMNTSVSDICIEEVDKELPPMATVLNPLTEKQTMNNKTLSVVSANADTQSHTRNKENIIQQQGQRSSDTNTEKSKSSTQGDGRTEATDTINIDTSTETISDVRDRTVDRIEQPQSKQRESQQILSTSPPTKLGQNGNDNPMRDTNTNDNNDKRSIEQSLNNITYPCDNKKQDNVAKITADDSSPITHGTHEKKLKTSSSSLPLEISSIISDGTKKNENCTNSIYKTIDINATTSDLPEQHQKLQQPQTPLESSNSLTDIKSGNNTKGSILSHPHHQQQNLVQPESSMSKSLKIDQGAARLNGHAEKNETNFKDDNPKTHDMRLTRNKPEELDDVRIECKSADNSTDNSTKKIDNRAASTTILPNSVDTIRKSTLHAISNESDNSKEDDDIRNSNTNREIETFLKNPLEEFTPKTIDNDIDNLKFDIKRKSVMHTANSACITKPTSLCEHTSPLPMSVSPSLDSKPMAQAPLQPSQSAAMDTLVNNEETEYAKRIVKIKQIATSVQKYKIELYLEAMKVHRGKDAEKKFADYWDAFGQYVSTPYSVHKPVKVGTKRSRSLFSQNDHSMNLNMRSNSDIATNGIEAILNSFLRTKSLKKKHNALVKAVMKQCFHDEVLQSEVQCHIPTKWNTRISKIDRSFYNNDSKTCSGEPLSIEWNRDISDFMRNLDSREGDLIFADSGQIKSSDVPTVETIEGQSNLSTESFSATRLPGMMEIEYISRDVMKQTDHSLSPIGLWFVTVAVKEYISKILQNTMGMIVNEKASDPACNSSDQTTCTRKRKRHKITPLDLVKSLDSSTCEQWSSSTRMAWERCISEIGVNSVIESNNTRFDDFQNHISTLLGIASEKRRKVAVSPNKLKEASVGKGKDLAAMVVRRKSEIGEERPPRPSSAIEIPQDSLPLKRRTSMLKEYMGSSQQQSATALNGVYSRRPSLSNISESNSQSVKPPSRPPSSFASDVFDCMSRESGTCSPAFNLLLSTTLNPTAQGKAASVDVTKRPSSPVGRNAKDLAAMMARNNSSRSTSPKNDKGKSNVSM